MSAIHTGPVNRREETQIVEQGSIEQTTQIVQDVAAERQLIAARIINLIWLKVSASMTKRLLFLSALLVAVSFLATACAAARASTNKPIGVITSPPSNSQFRAGEPVTIQSTSTDPVGIARVELAVDGDVVRTDASPKPQVSFTVLQTWIATPGAHVITVRAINTENVFGEPAAIEVSVLPGAITPMPTATFTPLPSRSCVNNSTFVADVTVSDGTVFAPGQTFDKIWRVRNTGTCAWGAGDVLAFVGGEAMTTTTAIALPITAPGAAADLRVAMTAPTKPGGHTGSWRLKGAGGAFFGATLNVVINVASSAPNPCPWTPVIESFAASPTTITAGQPATLNWGVVIGAERAEIDNEIGGVATPGSITVTPMTTTTYTLTATCGSKVRTAQVTINVVSPSPRP